MSIHGAGIFFDNAAACAVRTLRRRLMKNHQQQNNIANEKDDSKINVAFMRLLLAILRTALIVVAMIATAQAEPRRRHSERNHNYIIERQQAYQVRGVPTSRLIIGKREIDVYPNGLMFEKNNVVGVKGGAR